MFSVCGYKMDTENESKDSVTMRLRVAPEFKAEVEAVAKSKQLSVSALARLALAEYVEANHRAGGARVSENENGKEAA